MMQQSEKITLPEIASKRRHSRLRTGIQKSRMTGRKTGEQKMQFIGFDADTTAAYLPDLWLDAGHCVAERNEANNTTYQGNVVRDCQNIHVHVPKANLTVWRNEKSPDPLDINITGEPVNGVQMPISVEVINNGETRATGVRAPIYEVFGNTTQNIIDFGSPAIFNLEADQRQIVNYGWLPHSGDYAVNVIADPANTIVEYNENDNSTRRDIPELEVVDIYIHICPVKK